MQECGGSSAARFGVLSSGSGEGFALSAGLPAGIENQITLLARGESRRVDLGLITATGPRGAISSRYFVNETQIGIGAAVVAGTRGWRKRAGGLLGYGLATLAEIVRCPNRRMQMILDSEATPPGSILGLSVGNGARTGGGMSLTPAARIDDGHLDLLMIDGQSVRERLRSFPRIYSGAHLRARGFSIRAVRTMEVFSDEEVPVAADGEIVGTLPTAIRVVPSAIQMILPTEEGG
jgi:diacylglycerol kinase (ATP)